MSKKTEFVKKQSFNVIIYSKNGCSSKFVPESELPSHRFHRWFSFKIKKEATF